MSRIYTEAERKEKCIMEMATAIHSACQSNRGVRSLIAEKYGYSKDKVNNQTDARKLGHVLHWEVLEAVVLETQDQRILQSFMSLYPSVGYYFKPLCTSNTCEIMKNLGETTQKNAELVNKTLIALADGKITRDEYAELQKSGMETQAQIQTALELAEQKMIEDSK